MTGIVRDVAAIDPNRLRRAMEATGIPVAELARRINKSVSYTARIANGNRRLKRNPMLRRQIADALGVYVDWIEGRTGVDEDEAGAA